MRRTRPVVALGVVLLSLGGLGALDLMVDPPRSESPAVAGGSRDDVVSGRAVCAVGDTREGTTTRLELVHPGPVGGSPVRLEARRFGDEGATLLASQLFANTGAVATVGGDGEQATGVVEWQDAPLTVARRWRIEDDDELPAGTAAGPCPVSTAATTWTLPGVSTAGGTEALLRFANPHATGATVSVRFLTPEGAEAPTRLRNLSVGPEATSELSLNEFIPERDDVAVVVEVLSGRIAVEGVQLARSAIGDIDGVSLLQAATSAAETWTIPWVSDASDRSPWLWVANDDDRTARVELTVHGDEGGLPAEGLSEVEIPPRTVRRVDLRGVLPESGPAAVTVRSDGVPVTASGVVEIGADDPDDTGLVVQRGAVAADTAWTLTGGPTEERRERLRLVNPTGDPAVVDAILWNGASAELLDELSGIEIAAGAVVSIPLDDALDGLDRWALTVRSRSGAVVAGTVGDGSPDGPAHWVASIGTPGAEWTTAITPEVGLARGMVQRLGTTLGISPFDPFAPAPTEDGDADPDGPVEVPGAPDAPAEGLEVPDVPVEDGDEDGDAPAVPDEPDEPDEPEEPDDEG